MRSVLLFIPILQMKKLTLRLFTELGCNRTYTSSVCSIGLKQGQKTYQELKDIDSRLVQ